jgi:hypothetical protein
LRVGAGEGGEEGQEGCRGNFASDNVPTREGCEGNGEKGSGRDTCDRRSRKEK